MDIEKISENDFHLAFAADLWSNSINPRITSHRLQPARVGSLVPLAQVRPNACSIARIREDP
jgi:hypothetical protein